MNSYRPDWLTPSGRTPSKCYDKPPKEPSTSSEDCACNGHCKRLRDLIPDWTQPSGRTPPKARDKPDIEITCSDSVKGPGRKSYVSRAPEIIPMVKEYVESCGFRAHRRREDKPGVSGARSKDIAKHISDNVPYFRNNETKVSPSYVRHLMKPAHKGRKAADRYTGDINASKPAKRNNLRNYKEDSHRYNALVKNAHEFTDKYGGYSVSLDNKNKVPVGTPADGRRAGIKRFYPCDDAPNAADHDWPIPGYKLIPMGYLFLDSATDLTPIYDNLGRPHVAVSRSGQLYVKVRSSLFCKATIQPHANDLIELIPRHLGNPSLLTFITDNGPDYSKRSLPNAIFEFRLFLKLNLDALISTSYAPGDSAHNAVEHSWCPCTLAVAGQTLEATIENEDVPPCFQKISDDDKREKEAKVMDNAMDCYSRQLSEGAQFGGRQVICSYQPCTEADGPFFDYASIQECTKSVSKMKENGRLLYYLKMMRTHMNRHYDCLVFTKCTSPTCKHCSTYPVRNPDALRFLRRNPSFPCPIPDKNNPNHFATFLQIDSGDDEYRCAQAEPDIHMPKYQQIRKKLGVGRCLKCRYTFVSLADQKSHRRIEKLLK